MCFDLFLAEMRPKTTKKLQNVIKKVETRSNQILFHIAVEGGVLLPAGGEEGLADDGLDVGGDGAAAIVILVVELTVEMIDEVVLDGALQMVRHVVVHLLETKRHTDGLVWAILRTVLALHLGITEVDCGDNRIILRNIVLQDAAKAMLPDGTILTLTNCSFCRHFSEFLFFCLLSIFG